MEMLGLIAALSTIMWYLIDRFKPLWECYDFKGKKYITVALAAIAGFGLAFGYELDLIYAFEFVSNPSILGKIITGFTLMSGSSAISEIIEKIKK